MAAAMAGLAYYALQDRLEATAGQAGGDGEFVYVGALRNGLYDGYGEVAFADGAALSGEFLKGRCSGSLRYKPAADWRFEGHFFDGRPSGAYFLPKDVTATVSQEDIAGLLSPKDWGYVGGIGERGQNGEGRFDFPGGESYTGAFLLGLADGHGVYRGADGSVIYEGQWKAGVYHGQGRYTPPGGAYAYEGAFESGLPHGWAAYSEGGALRYSGEFAGGVPEGQGVYYSPAGWTYEGGFQNGVFHGSGVLTKNGEPIAGEWARGRQVGREQ
jgi:hypothetical protein